MNTFIAFFMVVCIIPCMLKAQPKSLIEENQNMISEYIPTIFLTAVHHDSLSRADDTLGYENRFGIGQTFNSSLYDIIEINKKNQQFYNNPKE